MEKHIHHIAFFQEFTIVNHLFRYGNLVVGFLVHQLIAAIFRVKILEFAALHPHFCNIMSTLKSVLHYFAGSCAF